MILTKKHLCYLFLLAIFLVIDFWLFGQTISIMAEQKEIVRGEVAQISNKILSQPDLEKITRDIRTKKDKIEKMFKVALIGENGTFEFIKFLEGLAGQDIDQKIKLGPPQKVEEGDWAEISMEITLRSSFLNINQYLYKLEKSDYYFDIESLEIRDLGSQISEESRVEAIVRGSIYSF